MGRWQVAHRWPVLAVESLLAHASSTSSAKLLLDSMLSGSEVQISTAFTGVGAAEQNVEMISRALRGAGTDMQLRVVSMLEINKQCQQYLLKHQGDEKCCVFSDWLHLLDPSTLAEAPLQVWVYTSCYLLDRCAAIAISNFNHEYPVIEADSTTVPFQDRVPV